VKHYKADPVETEETTENTVLEAPENPEPTPNTSAPPSSASETPIGPVQEPLEEIPNRTLADNQAVLARLIEQVNKTPQRQPQVTKLPSGMTITNY
jgi:hypothetical protein